MSNTRKRESNATVSSCSVSSECLHFDATGTVDDDILTSSAIIHLKNKAIDELLVMQKFSQDQLKRYEQALRTATPVLNERKQ